jgi:hypothetical protein
MAVSAPEPRLIKRTDQRTLPIVLRRADQARDLSEEGVRLAQKMQVGPGILVGIQL